MALLLVAWQALLDGLLGSTCAGCRRRGAGVACLACRAAAEAQPRIAGTTFLDQPPVTHMVRAAKFGRWRGGGRWFGEQLVARMEPDVRERIVAVAWVPRSASRARERGMDLPCAVATCAARLLGVPTLDLLVRVPGSCRQRGLDRDERRDNARASFDLHPDTSRRTARLPSSAGYRVDAVVLLVDDVCTTGATITACSALLTVAVRRRFRDIHVHPIAMASVPVRDSNERGVTETRSLRGIRIHENR